MQLMDFERTTYICHNNVLISEFCEKIDLLATKTKQLVLNYQGEMVRQPIWPLEKRGGGKDPSSLSRPDPQSMGGKQTWKVRELERWMTRRGKMRGDVAAKPVLDFPAR